MGIEFLLLKEENTIKRKSKGRILFAKDILADIRSYHYPISIKKIEKNIEIEFI